MHHTMHARRGLAGSAFASLARRFGLAALFAAAIPCLAIAEQPYTVTVSALNVRTGPGTSYAIIGTVALNQAYVADAVTNGGSTGLTAGWYRIWYRGNQGWCSGAYLAAAPALTAVRVNVSALNVRTGPGTQYTIVGQALLNQEHVLIGASGGWDKIWWGGGAYWVSGAYVTTVTVFTPPGSVAPPPAPSASLYGMNIDPANPWGNPTAKELKDAGVRWVRIEWKAYLGYSTYDPVIAAYRSAGLRVLLLTDYSTVYPKPSATAGDAAWSAYVTSFVNTQRALAAHYGNGVDAWQIWNEPDLADTTAYTPWVPPTWYGIMLRDSAKAVRTYSSRPVVTAGLASGNTGYLSTAISAAGGLTADAVCVHPYGQRAPNNWPTSTWGVGNMSDLFNRYLAFGKPLWVTEIGVATTDQTFQATYMQNVYKLVSGSYAGRVNEVFWFCWSDGMVSPYGVKDMNGAGNPKASYWMYRSIAGAW